MVVFLLYSNVNQLYEYIYPLFFRFPSHLGHHRILSRVPDLYNRFSLVTYFIHSVLVTQLCPTLGGLMDCSPPGSSVHGILQAQILEWGAIPFSKGSSRPRK